MAKVKVTLNIAAVKALRKSPEVRADLERRARAIAARANSQVHGGDQQNFDVNVLSGSTRARASVVTATPEAMQAEATRRVLTRSIDAGR